MSNQPVKPPQVSQPSPSTAAASPPATNNQTHSIYDRGPNPYQIAQRLGWPTVNASQGK